MISMLGSISWREFAEENVKVAVGSMDIDPGAWAHIFHRSFRTLDGSVKVKKEDLGFAASNFEHTWGKLI